VGAKSLKHQRASRDADNWSNHESYQYTKGVNFYTDLCGNGYHRSGSN
jgi:hypothetical protein